MVNRVNTLGFLDSEVFTRCEPQSVISSFFHDKKCRRTLLDGFTKPTKRDIVQLAQLGGAIRTCPELAGLRQDWLDIFVNLIGELDAPWSIFDENPHESLTAYTTAHVLTALGPDAAEVLDPTKLELAVTEVWKFTREVAEAQSDFAPHLVPLAIRSLAAIDRLGDEHKKIAGLWANSYLHYTQAELDSNVGRKLPPAHSFAALATLELCLPQQVHRGRHELIHRIASAYPILPEYGRTGLTRVSRYALANSTIDALGYALSLENVGGALLDESTAVQDTLDWLAQGANREDGRLTSFNSDVYPDDDRPELWFNAVVLSFRASLASRSRRLFNDRVVERYGGTVQSDAFSWEEIKVGGFRWKEVLQTRMVEAASNADSRPDFRLEQNGIILFGPPGTSKTSTTQSLAKLLGDWPLISLSPSHFLEDGVDGIFHSLNAVFSELVELENVVILFDELELLLLERNHDSDDGGPVLSNWTTGLVTNCMLPWFKELHDRGKAVYVVATNNIERIDSAIRRPGRFDFVLPVGPPSKEEARDLLVTELSEDTTQAFLDKQTGRETLGEILQWASEVRASEAPVEEASELWASSFATGLLISEERHTQFVNNVKKFSFPPALGQQMTP